MQFWQVDKDLIVDMFMDSNVVEYFARLGYSSELIRKSICDNYQVPMKRISKTLLKGYQLYCYLDGD